MSVKLKLTFGALALLSPLAQAHHIDGGVSHSLFSGFSHPFVGLDHLLLLLAMGVLTSKFSNKKLNLMLFPTLTLCVMAAGFGAGHLLGAINMMEAMILGSVFVAALAIWQLHSDSIASKSLMIIALCSVSIHGWAHGVESGSGSTASFALGMLLGSAIIMGTGLLSSRYLSSSKLAALIAGCGVLVGTIG